MVLVHTARRDSSDRPDITQQRALEHLYLLELLMRPADSSFPLIILTRLGSSMYSCHTGPLTRLCAGVMQVQCSAVQQPSVAQQLPRISKFAADYRWHIC